MIVYILGKSYDVETTTTLDFNNEGLASLPAEIGNLTKLQYLYLSNNHLTSLPAEIGNLTNLQYISLRNNSLTRLPPEIGNLTNLNKLCLNNNCLTTLPAEIGNLTKLQYLYLYNNNLTTLPAEIGNLTKLQLLYLSNNNLTSLPVKILKIKNKLKMDETSYEIDNMDLDAEFIVLTSLKKEICNLPITLKEIWLKEGIDVSLIKVPFGCEIKYFL